MGELHHAVAEALSGLRSQLSSLAGQVAAVQERPNFASLSGDSAVSESALARIEQIAQSFGARLEGIEKGMAALQDRMTKTEQQAEAAKQQVVVLHTSIAEDFVTFEQNLQSQGKAVESARTAMGQTDDLVERLVEALEALQATVLERSEEWVSAAS